MRLCLEKKKEGKKSLWKKILQKENIFQFKFKQKLILELSDVFQGEVCFKQKAVLINGSPQLVTESSDHSVAVRRLRMSAYLGFLDRISGY